MTIRPTFPPKTYRIDQRELHRRACAKNAKLKDDIARIDRLIRFLEYRRAGLTYLEIAKIERVSPERVGDLCRKAIRIAKHRASKS